MRNFLFILFLAVCTSPVFTQVYYAFPDSNAAWVESHSYGGSPCVQYWDREIYIQKDTVINAKHVKKLIYNEHAYTMGPYPGCLPGPGSYSNGNIYGYMRNDTLGKLVYLKNCPFSTHSPDSLLYDFSKMPGDTVFSLLGDYVIDSILNINIANGIRAAFYVHFPGASGQGANTRIIEGIGSASGLVYDPNDWEGGDQLICFSQNGQKIYPDTSGACAHINSVLLSVGPSFRVYPIPAGEKIYFEISSSCRIRITDLAGDILLERQLQENFVDVSSFKNGMYWMEIFGTNQPERKKIIIAH